MLSENEAAGIVFNIQKFSLNDGPGIRTVVFLKGCPLRCRWCANPESQLPNVQVMWDSRTCLHCLRCVQNCPHRAVLHQDDRIRIDYGLCSGCGDCAAQCPGHALTVEGDKMSVSHVLKICLQDRDFYEESRGGVTLSGGEVLSQPDFAGALLTALKAEGIHTAIETAGFATENVFKSVIRSADLLLFDIKHWDPVRHKAGTGVSNEVPLRNMQYAISSGKEVLPRLPVIPGFNDALSDVPGFAARLKQAGAYRVQLLPFHQFGENKYSQLGMDYVYTGAKALHEEDLEDYQKTFIKEGIEAFF